MSTGLIAHVLDQLELRGAGIVCLKDPGLNENASWLVDASDGQRLVLRRYHDRATRVDLTYEHAVLRHLAAAGWVVPAPLSPLINVTGRWYCATQFVPGTARRDETIPERFQRGGDLARLQVDLRGLDANLGQRPCWRAQLTAVTVHTEIDWDEDLELFARTHPLLASWASEAALRTRKELDALGAADLPVTIVHGDFAEWNVHYVGREFAGVVDFGLTHVDSRPYELAIARAYRAPEVIAGYRAELAKQGWPLSDLEEAAIEPIHHAFRVDMVAWQLDRGRRAGEYDTAMIEHHLARTGCATP